MSGQGLSRDNVRKALRDLPTSKVGVLEKIEGDTARCVVDGQVIPARFVAGLGLAGRVGEEVVITFIDKDLSDGIITGLVADVDTSDVDSGDFDALEGRVSVNEGLIGANTGAITSLDSRVGAVESGKVDKNPSIVAGEYPKIKFDTKGLVLKGSALVESDIPSLSAGKITSGVLGVDRIPQLAQSKIDGLGTALGLKADVTALNTHIGKEDNPHSVTKSQVGLSNVNNTSDLAKPISTATQTALNLKADTSALTSGLAGKVTANAGITGATKTKITYDSKGLVTGGADLAIADIPSGIERTSNKRSAWQTTPTDTAYPTEKLVKTSLDTKANTTVLTAHTGNKSNPHAVTKAQVGLGAYPASPADIGISTAVQTALDGKFDKHGGVVVGDIIQSRPSPFAPHHIFTSENILTRDDDTSNGTSGFLLFRAKDDSSIANIGVGQKNSVRYIRFEIFGKGINQAFPIFAKYDLSNDTVWAEVRTKSIPTPSSIVSYKQLLDSVDDMVDYVDGEVNNVMNRVYPVGSIHTSVNSVNPSTYFGFGTWVSFGAGRVPVGVDASQTEFNVVKKTGGAKTHKLTVGEMPKHSHTFNTAGSSGFWGSSGQGGNGNRDTSETGGGQAHNNLQPYITVYMWERTA